MHSHVTLLTGESEFAIFNILDINFLALNRGCHQKNKPALSQGSNSFLIIFLGYLEEFRRIWHFFKDIFIDREGKSDVNLEYLTIFYRN